MPLPKALIQVNLRIDPDLWERFVEQARLEEFTQRAALEEAISEWVSLRAATRTDSLR